MKRYIVLLCALLTLTGIRAEQTAQQATYDLTFVSYESLFTEADNDVFLILYTVEYSFTFRLDIIVEQGQQFFTSGKTYTWADMISKFCYTYVSAEYTERPFKDANFTWTKDAQGLEHMVGYAVDTLGNTYNFRYDVEPFIPTGDTITVNFTNSLKLEHSTEWYFTGTNDNGRYYLLLTLLNNSDSPVGHYTSENIDMSYSYIDKTMKDGSYEMLSFHDAVVDITAGDNDTLHIEASILAEDGNVYAVHAFYVEPKPLYHENITATDLYINTDYLFGMVGAIRLEASDSERDVFFALTPMSDDLNIYEAYNISLLTPNIGGVRYKSDPETQYDVYEGDITIELTDSGTVVSGTILCYNNVEYTIRLTHVVPEPTRSENLYMDGLEVQVSDQGAWRISGYNADSTKYISAVFNNYQIDGKYSYVFMSPQHSYIVTDIVWADDIIESYNYFDLIDANLSAEVDPTFNTVSVIGTMLGQNLTDVPLFNVELTTAARLSALPTVSGSPAAATKRLENGILIIEHNNHTYNAQGQRVK